MGLVTFQTYPTISAANFANGVMAGVWRYDSIVTNGLLPPFFLSITFVVIYAVCATLTPYKEHAMTTASFGTCVVGMLMVGMAGMTPYWLLFVFMIMIVAIYLSGKYNSG